MRMSVRPWLLLIIGVLSFVLLFVLRSDSDKWFLQAAKQQLPRLAIITCISPTFYERWALSITGKNLYAARHGYAHIVEQIPVRDKKKEAQKGGDILLRWIKPDIVVCFF